jgi:hypothetical protein
MSTTGFDVLVKKAIQLNEFDFQHKPLTREEKGNLQDIIHDMTDSYGENSMKRRIFHISSDSFDGIMCSVVADRMLSRGTYYASFHTSATNRVSVDTDVASFNHYFSRILPTMDRMKCGDGTIGTVFLITGIDRVDPVTIMRIALSSRIFSCPGQSVSVLVVSDEAVESIFSLDGMSWESSIIPDDEITARMFSWHDHRHCCAMTLFELLRDAVTSRPVDLCWEPIYLHTWLKEVDEFIVSGCQNPGINTHSDILKSFNEEVPPALKLEMITEVYKEECDRVITNPDRYATINAQIGYLISMPHYKLEPEIIYKACVALCGMWGKYQ